MIEKNIHFTVSSNPTQQQLENIARAKEKNPDFKIFVWKDPLKPTDFSLGKYFDQANSGAQLADLIRLNVVFNHGGFYLDSDFEFSDSLNSLTDYHDFCCASEDGIRLTNAFFGAPAGHAATEELVDYLLENEPDWTLPPDETTGPGLFTAVLKNRGDVRIIPRVLFYPYNWNEGPTSPHPKTIAAHTWSGSWIDEHSAESGSSTSTKGEVARKLKSFGRPALDYLIRKHGSLMKRSVQGLIHPNYQASGVIATKLSGGEFIFLDGKDISITPEVVLKGSYEEREEKFVTKHLHGGDWFVDVGANVGIFSLTAASKVGPFGRVFAFEPNEVPRELLLKSIVANWFQDRVNVAPCAVSDREGTAELAVREEVLGGAHLAGEEVHTSLDVLKSEITKQSISTTSLDNEFDENAVIRILKIDVEGHEPHVLKGARRLFQEKQVDYLLIEVIDLENEKVFRETLTELSLLTALGYQGGVIDHECNFAPQPSIQHSLRNNRSRNLVFANPDILNLK